MPDNTLPKYTVAFGLSLAVASVCNALLVIAKESSPAVQAAMKRLTGHHWITHVVLVLILFLILGFVFANLKRPQSPTMPVSRLIKTILSGIIAATLIIIGFYLFGD